MQATPPVFTVSQINRQIRTWLEQDVGEITIEGELSNLSKPTSGHLYFTLKDNTAQLRCAYFRNRHTALPATLQDGQQVLATGHLSLYEARGDYQLIINHLTESGQGNLFRQFELLKNKLSEEGLFRPEHKKALPPFPNTIGVITSETGAALRDILTTLSRRYPLANVRLYASEVQGKQAADALVRALNQAAFDGHCDVLILARGGGSMEDLWAFNDERLARTMAQSPIPIVSGIGHETDFTIADFVADLRAATPTAAAESVTPHQQDIITQLQKIQAHLTRLTVHFIQYQQLLLNNILHKLTSPGTLINQYQQTLDYSQQRLKQALQQQLYRSQHTLHTLQTRLASLNPSIQLKHVHHQITTLETALYQAMRTMMQECRRQFETRLAKLHVVSPLATLERGYSIVSQNESILSDINQVAFNEPLTIRLSNGQLTALPIQE